MKVIIATSTFPANDSDPVPAFVKDQIISMKAKYHHVDFYVLAPHDKRSDTVPYKKHESYAEYRFHYFWPHKFEKLAGRGILPALQQNPLRYLQIPFLFAAEFFALLRLTRKIKPDFIYAHWFTPQAVLSRWVGKITRTPFVFTTHAADVSVWGKIPLLGGAVVRSHAKKAVAITAVSERSMNKLEAFFKESTLSQLREKSAIIPMGVDIAKTKPSKKDHAKPQSVIFVGRLAEKKGLQYLIPAFAEVLKSLPKANLTIAGDGPMLNDLKKQAADLALEKHIVFPGFISGAGKASLISQSKIFVVPSIITDSGDAEGLPVSLMEGLSHGKICVATNESGADNIITDGEDGFLVPEKNTKLLADAIVKSLGLSTKQSEMMQLAAMKTAEQFAWPRIAKRHYDFLFKRFENG